MDPTKSGKMSDAELEKTLSEVMDPTKVVLHCGKHNYIAGSTPPAPIGCKNCWEAYWWYMIASTPPHLRMERLAQIEKSVREAVQMAERGEFDFEVYEHPIIEIKKGVN